MSISLPYGKLYHTIKNNKEEFNPRIKKREKKMYKTTNLGNGQSWEKLLILTQRFLT